MTPEIILPPGVGGSAKEVRKTTKTLDDLLLLARLEAVETLLMDKGVFNKKDICLRTYEIVKRIEIDCGLPKRLSKHFKLMCETEGYLEKETPVAENKSNI